MGFRDVLKSPRLYQAFQEGFGFFNARIHAVTEYLDIRPGMRIVDIGCGPGFIVKHLPKGVDYIGFDIDRAYIDYAQRHFGDRARFHCRFFDDAAAEEFAPADLVMMNGVVHHVPDDYAISTFQTIEKVLAPRGVLFTLDGCYREGQNGLAKLLLRNDRGEFVRTEPEYRRLLSQSFNSVDARIFENLSWVPYTFLFTRSSRVGI